LPYLPLTVVGELRAVCGAEALRITAQDNRIIVDIPDLKAARTAVHSLGEAKRRATALSRLDSVLRAAGLVVNVRLAARTIASFGTDVTQGSLARLLSRMAGVGPIRVRLFRLIWTALTLWFKRSPSSSGR
jgi:hypothetical protein